MVESNCVYNIIIIIISFSTKTYRPIVCLVSFGQTISDSSLSTRNSSAQQYDNGESRQAHFRSDNFALAMGNIGAYPPLLAAWAPFFLFLLIGEAVLIRTEE